MEENQEKVINSEHTKTEIIEQVVKTATIIYAFLVFCGALYFHFYYKTFRINIFQYLEVSEILVSFMHILIPTIISLFGLICGSYFVLTYAARRKFFSDGEVNGKLDLKHKLIQIVKNVWILGSCAFCIYYLRYAKENLSVSIEVLHYRNVLWVAFIITSIVLSVASFDMKFIAIIGMIIFVIASVYNAKSDVKAVSDIASHTQYTIVTEQDTITTNENVILVGRVNKSLFIYNKLDSSHIDIPVSEIKRIICE